MNRRESIQQAGGWLTGLAVFVLLLLTAGRIGVTWDEPIYVEAGERAARWLGLLLTGQVTQAFDPYTFGISWGLVNEHPPLMRVVSGLGWALSQNWLPAPLTHRLGQILLAGVVMGVMTHTVARERGWPAALFAVGAILTMPRLFFHMHLAALDFAVAGIWLMGSLLVYGQMKSASPGWRMSAVVGGWLGLALLTKITGVLLLPFWGLWLLIFRRGWRHLLLFAGGMPVALAVLVAGWPWIWQDPLRGLVNWVNFFQIHFEIRQWFGGQLYVETPWYLPFALVAITTPLLILALAGLGAVSLRRRDPWISFHLLGMAVGLGYYALPMTSIHDQERLLLPALLHLAILAGEGFACLLARLRQTGPLPDLWRRGWVAAALGALLLLPGGAANLRLHPFQLAYYNAAVGGVAGAAQRSMESIYFASAYAHFLPELNQLPPDSRVWLMPNSWDVLYYYQLHGLLRRDLILLRPPGWGSFYDDQGVPSAIGELADADFALIERRQTTFNAVIPEYAIQLEWAAHKSILAEVRRDGVILATLHGRE